MFFDPPPRRLAVEHARLPNFLRDGNLWNSLNAVQPPGLERSTFIEGPSFDRDGCLWFVDIVNGRILRIGPGCSVEVICQYDGWPNGLKIHRDGRVFVADHKRGIMVLDPDSLKIEPVLVDFEGMTFKGVNDLFFSSDGDLYFTDQGDTGLHDPSGRLFRMRPDGALTLLVSNIPSPNGIVMDLEERNIFVAATRDNSVWKVPLDRSGNAMKVGRFVQLSGGIGPDGLALSERGDLLIAHAGMGCVWMISCEGEPIARIDSPSGKLVTNLAFAPGTQDLYFLESRDAVIYRACLSIGGKVMFSHSTCNLA